MSQPSQASRQMMVFVSHSHQNNAFCEELVRALRKAGADVWYDDQSLHTGRLGPIIERELRARPVFIVVLSPAALTSQWVEDETRWAYNRLRRDPTRIILPVLAEALPAADDIWLFLQEFKRIEAPGVRPYPLAEAITKTLHALELTVPGEAPPPTAPQPTESAEDLAARGKALVAQQKYAEALPLFERATQLASNHVEAWYNRGRALGNLGRPQEALAAYDRALALDPQYAPAWGSKGGALQQLGRSQEALATCDRALVLDPNLAMAWANKGSALSSLKRYEEALAAYERATTLDPTYALAWSNKAYRLRALGRTAEAEAAERRAKELGG
jgi:tetratricopeptide (TPR) repeat protein